MEKSKTNNSLFSLFILLLVGLSVRSLIFEPFHIPSSSMKSTLLEGDYIFTSKYAYGYSRHSFPFSPNIFNDRIFYTQPKRGDIVVFKHGVRMVKRVIGLPGDKVQIINGDLHINDEKVQRIPYEKFFDYELNDYTPRYTEILPDGKKHEILINDTFHNLSYNTPAYHVPSHKFFVMGDNRNNSLDSRFSNVGFIPQERLIGRVSMVGLSFKLKKFQWLPFRVPIGLRLDRILRKV